ncbi:aldehyde dehydrogenase [Methylocystis sp. B8]|uniref:aldehyde dehydrogenase n=1 Tax=Methylocystis sp. B8 TaxID=544938 RepID=UPI0010FDE486|nr:aldehyde dehydrogenase [Methylocystis sp. B8]TLG71139.1 aldehyde dehydrogenase [Methylocystis sp. B8]
MSIMTVVEEANKDELSRLAGCYLFSGTKIWTEAGVAHRQDGPAVVLPDGTARWLIQGKDVTRAVNAFFYENKWPIDKGLDSPEKLALFKQKFIE